jgi:outer membrane protein assembly factor BamB
MTLHQKFLRTIAIVLVAGLCLLLAPRANAAPVISSFAPTAGTIGTRIIVTGTGFTGVSKVLVGGEPATFIVNSATQITAFVPPNATSGRIIVQTSQGNALSTAAFAVAEGSLLTPPSGTPRRVFNVAAVGFTPGRPVDIYFDTKDVALAVTNSRGALSINITVSNLAQPGEHWVTLIERGTNRATQNVFKVNTNWTSWGFNPQGPGANIYENTLSKANVSQLTPLWAAQISRWGNASPILVVDDVVLTSEVDGHVNALSATDGNLLWTADLGGNFHAAWPVAMGSRVFFADDDGIVTAFLIKCRSDGGVCSPLWARNSHVRSGLTAFQNKIYAPADNGRIHVIDPATGALGTPIWLFNATDPITTPVTFDSGPLTFAFAATNLVRRQFISGYSQTSAGSGVSTSMIANHAGAYYFTTTDGKIRAIDGYNWTMNTSGTLCNPPPVYALNVVYAGGCTTLAAHDAISGTQLWSVTTPGIVWGITYANGVLYACVNSSVAAYDATNGTRLWGGGLCNVRPIVVNGMVFAANGTLRAYGLPGPQMRPAAKPDPRSLRADGRLMAQRTPERIRAFVPAED